MKQPYSEDLFAETRMSFGEHLEDLRTHLMRALKGFLLCLAASLVFGWYVVDFIKRPVEDAVVNYHVEYYKKNPDKPNPVIEALLEEARKPDADPAMKRLDEPREIPVAITAGDFDQAMRRAFPQMFGKGGPLHGVEPPLGQAAQAELVTVKLRISPAEFIRQFQGPLTMLAKRSTLTTLSPQEAFMVYFKVSMLCGFVLGSPWIFFQIWSFVAAGLYPHEKSYVYYSLAPSVGLFLSGVVLCQFLIIPAALKALLGFNLWLNIEPDLRLNEWLGFAILMPVVTGLCFQTPLVMFVLGKIGIFTPEDFAAKRKIAIFVMLVFCAIVSPSVDVLSLFLLWVPMVALYELGIWMVRYSNRRSDRQDYEEPYVPAGSGRDQSASSD